MGGNLSALSPSTKIGTGRASAFRTTQSFFETQLSETWDREFARMQANHYDPFSATKGVGAAVTEKKPKQYGNCGVPCRRGCDGRNMKARLLLLVILTGSILSVSAEEVMKDKSPDGKFALRMIHGKDGWDTEIIETETKKKVIDLENQGVAGDEARVDYAMRTQQPIGTYGHDATLIWSGDSQRVAYFNESRELHATSVYFRKGNAFAEIPLPEFPRCDEVKEKNPKDLKTIFYTVTPKYWLESGALFLSISGDWESSNGQIVNCEQSITLVFDAEQHASVQKAEKKPEPIGRKIESPKETFFVEELNAPAKDDDGRPRMDQEVWIVSAKDPAIRERLPGFYEEEGSGVLNGARISPDENWIVISQHHGSHLNSTYLMRRKEGLKFEDAFPDAKWPGQEHPTNRFDNEVWKFFSKMESVPTKKIDANELGATPVSVLEWSEDSGLLLLELHGGLTGDNDIADRGRYDKPGVSGWLAYYNTKTRKFELTERLRKANHGARKRWTKENEGTEAFLPPSAESIGHEGASTPVDERLKKYETELGAIAERRKSQLDGADRAEFERSEAEWRDGLDKESSQIKDKPTQLALRARSTWDHLNNVREYWLPVYEPRKVEAEKK